MRPEPPDELVRLLQRLGLATPQDVRRVWRRVRRLGRDLPQFESVWVDALAQARTLTPLQAAWINAGRGEELAVGPYVCARRSRGSATRRCIVPASVPRTEWFRLMLAPIEPEAREAACERLEQTVAAMAALGDPRMAPIERVGTWLNGVWATCASVDAPTAAYWLVKAAEFPARSCWKSPGRRSNALLRWSSLVRRTATSPRPG